MPTKVCLNLPVKDLTRCTEPFSGSFTTKMAAHALESGGSQAALIAG
jgi:hypothetical protein